MIITSLPDSQTADVWWISFPSIRPFCPEYWECLGNEERARAASFLREEDRQRFIISHACLRKVLGGYLGKMPAHLEFVAGEFGKPYLTNPTIEFNLSHSGDWGVIGVARMPIGIDIEQICPIQKLDSLAEHFFSPTERQVFAPVDYHKKLDAFYRWWCRKEAYLKATGRGLASETTTFSVSVSASVPALLDSELGPLEITRWSFHDLEPPLGYAAAIVVEGPLRRVIKRDCKI
jgi:4'-phosphopantetheinyl transferase